MNRTIRSALPSRVSCLGWAAGILLLLAACSEEPPSTINSTTTPCDTDSTRLFSRLDQEGCKAQIGLIAMQQKVSKSWLAAEKSPQGARYICRLGFCPSDIGAGRLTLDRTEIPQRSETEAAQGPAWRLLPGEISSPLTPEEIPFRISRGSEQVSKILRLDLASASKNPQTRMLILRLRGERTYNRFPTLTVHADEERIFQAVIPHTKTDTYRIPFLQRNPSIEIRFTAGLNAVSIPTFGDESGSTAYLQVEKVSLEEAPHLVLDIPNGAGAQEIGKLKNREAEFTWVEFPSRPLSPVEKAFLTKPSEDLRSRYFKAALQKNERLGRVLIPGLKMRAPACFTFPVEFDPGSGLSFSVGLPPTLSNYIFVRVLARDADSGPIRLIDEVVAQPLMEPDFLWHSFSVPFSPGLEGSGTLEFSFMDAPDSAEPGLGKPEKDTGPAAFAVFGNPRIVPADQAMISKPPNAILICMDTLRGDHLSCCGYPFPVSPSIDRLAEESLLFENAISTSSWTLPSHLAFLSGIPLGQHDLPYKHRKMRPGQTTVAGYLKNLGYYTSAYVGGGYVGAEFGMDQGFDYFDENSLDVSRGFPRVEKWLETRESEEPFFLFFHFFDVHTPYGDKAADPRRFFDQCGCACDENLVKEIQSGAYTNEGACGRFRVDISNRARHHMIHLYDADIAHADEYMQRLFDLLQRLELYDTTTIIITSDHGEEFGEHGNWQHSKNLYREVVRVPMILKPPKGAYPIGRISTPVSTLDIAPTLAELAGAPPDPAWQGSSLMSVAASPEDFSTRPVLSENIIEQNQRVVHMIALQDRTTKYFRLFCLKSDPYPDGVRGFMAGERQELYLLGPDPLEMVDLSTFYPQLTDKVRKASLETIRRLEKESAGPIPTTNTGLSDETLERLKALGYMK